jgi:multidrug efflux pump subunit AcrB
VYHYNFRRAVTVESDLDKGVTDTVQANQAIANGWRQIAHDYPDIDLDYSGELEDIQESLDALPILFLFGIGLIYLILGTQFQSYWQPFMILITVPMAFTGVIVGIIVTRDAVSLYTLYGIVALSGIAVNAAIVLISAANSRLQQGMTLTHAALYAARRRVIPILITSLTTIAGLFSLATGLGGHSLIWGPVASSIVWGLSISTLLTLFVIPTLYRVAMARPYQKKQRIHAD